MLFPLETGGRVVVQASPRLLRARGLARTLGSRLARSLSFLPRSSSWGGGRTAAGCAPLPRSWMGRAGFGVRVLPRSGCISAAAADDSWLVGSATRCGYSGLQRGWLGRDRLVRIKSCWRISEQKQSSWVPDCVVTLRWRVGRRRVDPERERLGVGTFLGAAAAVGFVGGDAHAAAMPRRG